MFIKPYNADRNMANDEAGTVIDWGYLDAIVRDYFPTGSRTENTNLGFEQISSTEAKIAYSKERLASPYLRLSK
jgi:hypothetical protein